jgi:hypothetical protein
MFLELRDFPIMYGEYVGEVTLPLPAGGGDMPRVVTQRNNPITLGYEFSWLELPSLLGIAQAGEESSHFFDAMVGAAQRYSLRLGHYPLDIAGKPSEYALDVSVLEVPVLLLHELYIFLFAHGQLLLSDPLSTINMMPPGEVWRFTKNAVRNAKFAEFTFCALGGIRAKEGGARSRRTRPFPHSAVIT